MKRVSTGEVALGEADDDAVRGALQADGLWLDLGALTVRVRGNCAALAGQLRSCYPHFPFRASATWADVHVHLRRPFGVRRWVRPIVSFVCDSGIPFAPFPADSPLPLLEWGCNWLIGQQMNDLLLLHAGAVERDGLALVMPAVPGSGKSTLTAALSQRGWRLLSDEFGAFAFADGRFHAILKPVALKNQSIGVIRQFAPSAVLGPEFQKTRKGTVAHLAATKQAVCLRHEPARPGAFLLPRWEAGSATRLERLSESRLFSALAFNAFNYNLLGEAGFSAVVNLVRRCSSWQLVYSDLGDALMNIDRIWSEVIERQTSRCE